MNSKGTKLGFLLLITTTLLACSLLLKPKKEEVLAKVYMLNVGQGDSFLIEASSGAQILIDGGRDATVLSELGKVMPWNDRSIDVIVATHPDADHIGGLVSVIKRYDIGLFLTSDVYSDTQTYKSLITAVLQKNIPAYYVRSGMNLNLDTTPNTDFTVLFPDRNTHTWETNAASVVGKLQIGERSMLFTGDSPISVENYLAKKIPSELDVDILKLGHHGSKTSTSPEYLRATTPGLALISAGVNNSYGHPHKEVLDLLKKFNIPFVSTQTVGTYTLETDGVKWYRK